MRQAAPQPLIEAPQLLTGRERTRDALLTALMWGLYFYLWLPIISLIAWLTGIDFAYDIMVRAGGAAGLRQIIAWYELVLVLIIVLVSGWSISQRVRFRGRERRRFGARVSDEELMSVYRVDVASLQCLREGRHIVVSLDEEGWLQSVREAPADS